MEAKETETLFDVYQERLAAVHTFIAEWWEKKLQIDQQHNHEERSMMKCIQRELEATSVVMTRLLKTFSDEYHGRKSVVRSYIEGVASQVKAISGMARKNGTADEDADTTKEVDAFLQRVEHSLKIEVGRYQRLAADLLRSLHVRIRGIEDGLLAQRKIILQKAKVKTAMASPYIYSDIHRLDELMINEIRSRTFLNAEIEQAIATLAREEFQVLVSFRDNLQSLSTTYPHKFNDNFLYPAMLADLKKMLEREEVFRLKYYTVHGIEDLRDQPELEAARATLKKFSEDTEQRVTREINFQQVYDFFFSQLVCRRWQLKYLTNEKNESWEPCTGLVLISNQFLLVGKIRELLDEFDMTRTTYRKEPQLTVSLLQTDKPKGLRRLFRSEKTHRDVIRFESEEELEVFELHFSRCK